MKSPGERLIDLFQELGATAPQARASDDDLRRIRDYITAKSRADVICEWYWSFLKDILRAEPYSGRIITVYGANSFLEDQEALEELPANSGFVQFAHWTGDSDGDAWVFDAQYDCIRCIGAQLMVPSNTMDTIRAYSYGVFFNFHSFPSFLRGVSEERGWLRK